MVYNRIPKVRLSCRSLEYCLYELTCVVIMSAGSTVLVAKVAPPSNITQACTKMPELSETSPGSLIGRIAPDFALPDSEGEYFSLHDFRRRKLILVFLRHFA